jgi:two-component system sensor histidine kinase MprB
MPLRRRLTLATALVVGIAVALACTVAYAVVRGQLRGQVDVALLTQAGDAGRFRPEVSLDGVIHLPPLGARFGGSAPYAQYINAQGDSAPGRDTAPLPVSADDRALAASSHGRRLRDVEVDGVHVRVLTQGLSNGLALQLGRSLDGVDSVLGRLRLILLALCAAGIALAAFLGRLLARNLLAPILRVSDAARHISETEDLRRRIAVDSHDEVGELALRFNAMLATLEASIGAQRQLVADASHELRTPITSLRTNIEVLAEEDRLEPAERARIVGDAQAQAEELSALVGDVIELARGDEPARTTEDVRLDRLVAEAVERARRHAPGVRFEADLRAVTVEGAPDRLARAVNNLLDNATRHSPPGGVVEVRADAAGVRVRDHGPGIAAEDLPHIFDRFYRGAAARGRPGTGLGLAIVRQVAEQHGGDVRAANADGGGAAFELRLAATAA